MLSTSLLTSSEGTIQIGERAVNFEIIRSLKRKRSIALKIENKDSFVIMAPKRTSKRTLQDFLNRHIDWLQKKMTELEQLHAEKVQRNYTSGEMFPFLGENYPLRILKVDVKNVGCTLVNEEIVVQIMQVDQGLLTETLLVQQQLIQWYQTQAMIQIRRRLVIWWESLKVKSHSFQLSNARRRWGSCNRYNELFFNWRIVFAPIRLLDYLIVHELCHIVHKNHSTNFWGLVKSVIPDYAERKRELKNIERICFSLFEPKFCN